MERDAEPGAASDGGLDHEHHGRRAGGRLPAAGAPRRPSATGLHGRQHPELQRADVLLRRGVVHAGRRRLERVCRDRRRDGK